MNEPRVTAFWQAAGHDTTLSLFLSLQDQRKFRLISTDSRIHSRESNYPTFPRNEFSPSSLRNKFCETESAKLYRAISNFTFHSHPCFFYFLKQQCYAFILKILIFLNEIKRRSIKIDKFKYKFLNQV